MSRGRLESILAASPSRRAFLHSSLAGLCGVSASGWFRALARSASAEDAAGGRAARRRQCILLWMTGGPSQIDTFDLKPGHANGGPFKAIDTNVAGVQVSEHLPKLASLGDQLAVLRGLSTKEGDHGRGTFVMRTGHPPGGPISYPTIGSLVSKELGDDAADVPNYVSVSPYRLFNREAFQPGFLGPRHAALTVAAADNFQNPAPAANNGYAELGVDDLKPPTGVTAAEVASRLELLASLQSGFVDRHRTAAPIAHKTVYERAVRMMHSEAAKAFDLGEEPAETRERYGRSRFGQGCLMARRLIERGVAFVEVSLGSFGNGTFGWDTHQNNFNAVKSLSQELDAGWAHLMIDLKDRGLLESTTILWMGEFGRTPKINPAGGRDHYPKAWTAVLAGGGVKGGQAFGKTDEGGEDVADGRIDVGDLLATLCRATGIDPKKQNLSEVGRPIRIAEGTAVEAVLASPRL